MSSFTHSTPNIWKHIQSNGDDSPIWITESGWTKVEDCSNCDWQPELPTTEAEQAAYLTYVFDIIESRDYLDAHFYYTLSDKRNPDPTRWEDHFGLFRSDLTPKPAAFAFRNKMFPYNIFIPLILSGD